MELTLTHLDGTVNAHALVPHTDPITKVTGFTGRPGRSGDRPFSMTQDLLIGFGVRNDITGPGRNLEENIRHVKARFRAYRTELVVVRHADMLHAGDNTETLDLLAQICSDEGVSLALTCDDSTGQVLANWVDAQGGLIEDDSSNLSQRVADAVSLDSHTPASEDVFPRNVPASDFYRFRNDARDLLIPQHFAVLDACYTREARAVLDTPFTDETHASEYLLARLQLSDNPGKATTILRAAQAAMFRHGIQLKVDVEYFTRLVKDCHHRPMSTDELRSLRGYRATWRSAAVALLESGLSYESIKQLTMDDVTEEGSLVGRPEEPSVVKTLLGTHRAFRHLSGAEPADAFIPNGIPSLVAARRDAAVDLGVPGDLPQRNRQHTAKDRWRKHLGVVMLPLTGSVTLSAYLARPELEAA